MAIVKGRVFDDQGLGAVNRIVRLYNRSNGKLLFGTKTTDGEQSDPHYNNVVLLLRGEGAEGTNTFRDFSPYSRSYTITGPIVNSESQVLFDGYYPNSSIYMNNGYIRIPASVDFAFGLGDFTIEFNFKFIQNGNSRVMTNRIPQNAATGSWSISISNGGISISEVINGEPNFSTNYAFQNNVWYRIALSRKSGMMYVFIDGLLVNSGLFERNFSYSGYDLIIGSSINENYFYGRIEEIRITKGVARYDQSYTPTNYKFPVSNDVDLIGSYFINVGSFSGEADVLFLDDSAGSTYNDIVKRVNIT